MAPAYGILIIAVPGDAHTASGLAESIRRYRLPRGVALGADAPDYRRIATESGQTPLDDAVRELLDQSAALVLLCSPEVKDSQPILDRLNYYKNAHPDRDITPVLSRGEPADSFPPFFIEKREAEYILPDMSVIRRTETIEPIAADLRADNPRRWREVLRYETVRITASVLGLHPDDLEQRHLARRKRAVATALVLVGAVSLTAAALFLRLGFIAKSEGDVAAEQTRLSVAIARRTMEELPASCAGEPEALAYIDEAIEEARQSLDELGLGDMLAETENGGGQ